MASRPRRGAAAAAASRPDPEGLSRCAFYVSANGFGADASRLVCASRAYAHGGADDESFLSGLLLCEKRDVRAGRVVAWPRIIAAAQVGDAARVRELVRAGADLRATDKRGYTCLMAAARKQRVAVVRELLSTAGVDGALVIARMAAGHLNAGHSAYSTACYLADDSERMLSEAERAAAAACVALLAASPLQAPGDLGGSDATALSWACHARLPGIVSSWLADVRCTRAVVAQQNVRGHSAYSISCFWARDIKHELSEAGRVAAASCASALARSPHIALGDTVDARGRSALQWACRARLTSVVAAWVVLPPCTLSALTDEDNIGESPISVAYADAHHARNLSASERSDAAVCARLLAVSPHLSSAQRMKLFLADEPTATVTALSLG